MGGRGKIATLLALAALVWAGAALGIAGEQQDPNLDDELLGKDNGVRYSSDTNAFNPLNQGYASAEAGCGGSAWHLLGGGIAAQGDPATSQTASSGGIDFTDADVALDDGYRASGYGAKGGTITSFAICRKGGGISTLRREVPDGSGSGRSATIRCSGPGRHVASGSTSVSTSESWTNNSYPIDGSDRDRVPDDGWKGRVYDTIGGRGGFQMYLICSKADDLAYVTKRPVAIPPSRSAARTARCGGSRDVVGGGARLTGPIASGKLLESRPVDDGDLAAVPDNGWRAAAHNSGGGQKMLTVFAICRR